MYLSGVGRWKPRVSRAGQLYTFAVASFPLETSLGNVTFDARRPVFQYCLSAWTFLKPLKLMNACLFKL